MLRTWELYKGASRAVKSPVVSLLRTGVLNLNPAAVNLLGKDVQYLELFYDRKGQRIGLKPVLEPKLHARKLTRSEHSASINLKGFLKDYGIAHRKTTRFATQKEEDLVVIDLKCPL